MSLAVYKKKRNFKNTPEPVSGKHKKNAALTFVVQRHDATRLHYDFRLEMEGVLKSWAVPKGPSMNPGDKRLAVLVEDHPLDYGKFYGEIPKGNYGAGTVDIWDYGTYEPMEKTRRSDQEKLLLSQFHKGDIKLRMHGKHLQGTFALVRMNDGEGKNWLLIKKADEFAVKKYDIEKEKPVKVHGSKQWISRPKNARKAKEKSIIEDEPDEIEKESIEHAWKTLQQPMLAKLTAKVVDNPDWLYEMKFDGYRAVTRINHGEVQMVSRNGNSFNKQYSPLIDELKKIKLDIILDGEVVVENDKGVSNFQLLQNYGSDREGTLKYYVYDILFLSGHRLTSIPLKHRKELLTTFFKKYKFKNIHETEYVVGKGEQLFKKFSSNGYEGIIAKDMEAGYAPGRRSDSWLKIKTTNMQEAVICGYTMPQNSRKYFGSIILGVYEGDELKYVGNAGTGFSDSSLKELFGKFQKLETDKMPFPVKPVMYGMKGKPVWLKPKLVCNIKFSEWTKDGSMRHPVFMGLRTDKSPEDVVRENGTAPAAAVKDSPEQKKDDALTIGGKKVKLTNLTKIYWPEEKYTKGDLIAYYQKVAKYILPYLKNRPESLNRYPNGIKGESFYQKDMNPDQLPDWIKTVKLYSKSNNANINYLLCNDEASLVYMANLGCIEINPWHSTYDNPDYPDYTVIDLDPGEIEFVDVVNAALIIKEICDELQIDCYCKTSGATGLHIYIPLGAKYTYDEAKTFTEILANIAHQRLPHTTSIERIVSKRKEKIYLDFLQNRKGQTIAAPYSVRPKPGATVSTPLLWKEVTHKLTPQMFTIENMPARLEKVGDLWKGVLGKPINLVKVLKSLDKL